MDCNMWFMHLKPLLLLQKGHYTSQIFFPSLSYSMFFPPFLLLGTTSFWIILAANYDLTALVGFNDQKKFQLENVCFRVPWAGRFCLSHQLRKSYFSFFLTDNWCQLQFCCRKSSLLYSPLLEIIQIC